MLEITKDKPGTTEEPEPSTKDAQVVLQPYGIVAPWSFSCVGRTGDNGDNNTGGADDDDEGGSDGGCNNQQQHQQFLGRRLHRPLRHHGSMQVLLGEMPWPQHKSSQVGMCLSLSGGYVSLSAR